MPNCQAIDTLITPYVDHELPEADCLKLDEHLRRCAPCHSRVAAEQAVRNLVHARQRGLCRTAPPFLRAKCSKIAAEARAHAAPATFAPGTGAPSTLAPRSSWTSRLAPMAMAASLVTVVGGAFLYQATHQSARVMA